MESSVYMAVAAQRVLKQQLEVVAHNIANARTTGFRAESVQFGALVSPATADKLNFPSAGELHASKLQGTTAQTGNPLDVAIVGKGFLAIQTDSGVAYTRDGRFQISPFGELQSIEGHPVLDTGGAPVLLPQADAVPVFNSDGRIEVGGRLVGNIGVFDLQPENVKARVGNSAFLAQIPPEPIAPGDGTKLQQGFLENSNVEPVREMANLIAITRAYESAAKIIEKADNTISKSVTELARR